MDKKVVLDAAAAAALKDAEPGVELVGPDGQLVGAYVPPSLLFQVRLLAEEQRQRYADALRRMSMEELKAKDIGPGIPHEEAMKRWGME